ncbi:OTU protein [Polyrhizophydium stewartii]|uniref:OTU protein n=1 Tax=Polyrhizophydium stewartii TaxID=2732419 RepID=A0ABR4NEN2_9FUNG
MSESVGQQAARHQREVKELAAHKASLLKAAGKSKAKRREALDRVQALEYALADRHAEERAALEALDAAAAAPAEAADDAAGTHDAAAASEPAAETAQRGSGGDTDGQSSTQPAAAGGSGGPKTSRQAKRKERKAALAEQQRLDAEAEAALEPNWRQIETAEIERKAAELGRAVKEIVPDGHCLFNALADQLALVDAGSQATHLTLRAVAAEFMRSHQDDFAPFMVNDNGDMLSQAEFEQYCDKMEREAVWGGQLEIQAISQVLRRPIHVVQRGSGVLQIGQDQFGDAAPLFVSYHRHAYGLGEHYNSLVPAPPS